MDYTNGSAGDRREPQSPDALGAACRLPLPFACGASGLGRMLKNSPFTDFTEADYKQFFAAVKQAADGPVSAPPATWANAESGAQGNVQSVRAFHRAEGDCRELAGTNTARWREEPYRVTVCKASDGSWRLAPSEPKAKTAPAPAADPSGFPVKLPASFSGVLPCADCPGMQYRVEFHEDGSYRLRTTYLEKGVNVDDAGAWHWCLPTSGSRLRDDRTARSPSSSRTPIRCGWSMKGE